MSLDLWMAKPECPTCKHSETTENMNYTYNVSPMWYAIFPDDRNMIDIDGMTGEEANIQLKDALSCLVAEPKKFQAMEPENNWGSYHGFIIYIMNLIEECNKHPDWIWGSYR